MSKEPEDLGIKVGSTREAYLRKVKMVMEEESESAEFTLYFNKRCLELVEKLIDKEKRNFK